MAISLNNYKKIKIELSWKASNRECLIDVFALPVDENDIINNECDVVFFGNNTGCNGSIVYENNIVDTDIIEINFTKLPCYTKKIMVVLCLANICDNFRPHPSLKDISEIGVRILDANNDDEEFIKIHLADAVQSDTAITLLEIYHNNVWNFDLLMKGYQGGIIDLLGEHGIKI